MKTIDTFLCIGGPADGQRHVMPTGQVSFQVEERLPVPEAPASDLGPTLLGYPTTATHRYNRYTIHGHDSCFRVWLHERSNPDDAFKRLIDCYAKGEIE